MSQYNVGNLADISADRSAIADGQTNSASPVTTWMADAEARIAALNDAITAVAYQQTGTSAPSGSAAGQIWHDSSNDQWNGIQTNSGTWRWGTKANKIVQASGVDQNSYNDGTGTSGSNNTAQIVKQITLKANSINALGKGIRITYIWQASTSTSITTKLYLGTAGTTSDLQITSMISSATTNVIGLSSTILYLSSTTVNAVNFSSTAAGVAGVAAGSTNIATGSDMTISVDQSAVSGTHITVFALFVEQLG